VSGKPERLAYLERDRLILWDFDRGNTRTVDLSDPESRGPFNAFALSPTASDVATINGTRGAKTEIQVRSVDRGTQLMKQKIGGWPLQLVFTGNSGLFVAVRRVRRPMEC